MVFSTRSPFNVVVLLSGFIIGCLVVVDPYITSFLSRWISMRVGGINILRLYPYEFSSLMLFFLITFFVFFYLFVKMIENTEKMFIILFLATYFTVRLHLFGRADGTDFVFVFFLLIFLLKIFVEGQKVTGFTLILLNLFFLLAIIPSSINGGLSAMLNCISKIAKFGMISFLVANFVNRKDLFKFLIKWFIIFTAISALIAVLQEIIFFFTGTALVGFVSRYEQMLMFESTSFGILLRVAAFMPGYKMFSNVLLLSLMLIFNLFLYNKPKERKIKILLILSSILMIISIILTFSKDALLALIIIFSLSCLFKWPHRVIHIFLGVTTVVLFSYLSGFAESVLNVIHVNDFSTRLQLLREGIHGFITQHPWVGSGIGQGPEYTAHVLKWPVHNGIILAADEFGLLGLFSFLVILGYIVYRIIALNLTVKIPGDKWIVRGVLFGFLGFFISINFHPTLMDNLVWVYLGIVYAMSANLGCQEHRDVLHDVRV